MDHNHISKLVFFLTYKNICSYVNSKCEHAFKSWAYRKVFVNLN